MKVVVTGGAGFIASYVVGHFYLDLKYDVIVLDRTTYAAKVKGLRSVLPHIKFLTGNLREKSVTDSLMRENPDAIVHMAAETHVDRSIDDPLSFVKSNIEGTVQLLQSVYEHHKFKKGMPPWPKIIVYSTDEVYGPTPEGERFDESQGFNPSNAYSASKVGIEAYCNSFAAPNDVPPAPDNL